MQDWMAHTETGDGVPAEHSEWSPLPAGAVRTLHDEVLHRRSSSPGHLPKWFPARRQSRPLVATLLSPTAFARALTAERDRTNRNGNACSMVLFHAADHPLGDPLSIAHVVRGRLRPYDSFCCLDPRRLAVLLPEADAAGAWIVALDVVERLAKTGRELTCEVLSFLSPDASGTSDTQKEPLPMTKRLSRCAFIHSIRAVRAIVFSVIAVGSTATVRGQIAIGHSRAGHSEPGFIHVNVDLAGPAEMHCKAAGDLNGDGFVDLVIAGTDGAINWYEDRTASPAWTRHVMTSGGLGAWSTDAECGDLDGDGDSDLFVSDWYLHGHVGWFENAAGDGSTWVFHDLGAPRAHDIELADFDGDGDLDAVTRQQGAQGKPLELWRNDGAGVWLHATYTPPSASKGEGLDVSDLDADGDPDIVLGDAWYENLGGGFPNDSWGEHVYATGAVNPDTFPRTGDVNGDGRLDIVTTPSETAGGVGMTCWYEAPLDPRMTPWPQHVIDAPIETVTHSLGVGDMDLDGDLDVVTAEMRQGANPDEIRIYWNEDGVGGAWTLAVVGLGGTHSLRLVDAGGDGDLDIFGANWTGTTRVDLWKNLLH